MAEIPRGLPNRFEKIKDEIPNFTQGRSIVFYNADPAVRQWEIGLLGADGADLNDTKDRLVVDVQGRGQVELTVAPRVFDPHSGDVDIMLPNGGPETFQIGPPIVGPHGEIEYTLTGNAGTTLEHINHELIDNLQHVEQQAQRIEQLQQQAGQITTIKRKEVEQKITELRAKHQELEHSFGRVYDWTDADQKQAEALEQGAQQVVKDMDAIAADIGRQIIDAQGGDAAGHGVELAMRAEGLQSQAENEFKKREQEDKDLFEREKQQNEQDQARYASARKAYTKESNRIQGLQNVQQPDKDAQWNAWKANPVNASIVQLAEDPALIARYGESADIAVEIKPEDCRSDATRTEEERKVAVYMDIYNDLTTKGDPRSIEIKNEIDRRRQRQARDKDSHAQDYPRGTAAEIAVSDAKTAAFTEEVIAEYKDKQDVDIDAELSELQTRIAGLKGTDDASRTEVEEIKNDHAALVRNKKNLPATEQGILTLWERIGNFEVDATRKTFEAAETKELEHLVDIPAHLMREVIESNATGARNLLERVYQDAIDGVSLDDQSLVTESVRFIQGLNPSPQMRLQLREYGIQDWDVFARKWEKNLAQQFAQIFRQMAEGEMNALLSRRSRDIRNMDSNNSALRESLGSIFDLNGWNDWRRVEAGLHGDWNIVAYQATRVATMIPALAAGVGTRAAFGVLNVLPGGSTLAAAVTGGVAGGVAGGVRGMIRRALGKDKRWYEEQRKEVEKRSLQAKKEIARDALLARMFRTDDQRNVLGFQGEMATGQTARNDRGYELAALLSQAIRRTTESAETMDEAIVHNNEEIKLTDINDIVAYKDLLRRAEQDQGIDVEMRQKFTMAKALLELRKNREQSQQTQTESGTEGTNTGLIGAIGKRYGISNDIASNIVIGAGIGALVSSSDTARMAIAGFAGGAAGASMMEQRIDSGAERQATVAVTNLLDGVREALRVENQAGKQANQFVARDAYKVLSTISQGKMVDASERFDAVAANQEAITAEIQVIQNRASDVAAAIKKNPNLQWRIDAMLREIVRSGLLEQEIAGQPRLDSAIGVLERTRHKLDTGNADGYTEAKNTGGITFGRWLLKNGAGIIGAGVGAGLAYMMPRRIHALDGDQTDPSAAVSTPDASSGVVAADAIDGGSAATDIAGADGTTVVPVDSTDALPKDTAAPPISDEPIGPKLPPDFEPPTPPGPENIGDAITVDYGEGITSQARDLQNAFPGGKEALANSLREANSEWTADMSDDKVLREWRIRETARMGINVDGGKFSYDQYSLIHSDDNPAKFRLVEMPNGDIEMRAEVSPDSFHIKDTAIFDNPNIEFTGDRADYQMVSGESVAPASDVVPEAASVEEVVETPEVSESAPTEGVQGGGGFTEQPVTLGDTDTFGSVRVVETGDGDLKVTVRQGPDIKGLSKGELLNRFFEGVDPKEVPSSRLPELRRLAVIQDAIEKATPDQAAELRTYFADRLDAHLDKLPNVNASDLSGAVADSFDIDREYDVVDTPRGRVNEVVMAQGNATATFDRGPGGRIRGVDFGDYKPPYTAVRETLYGNSDATLLFAEANQAGLNDELYLLHKTAEHIMADGIGKDSPEYQFLVKEMQQVITELQDRSGQDISALMDEDFVERYNLNVEPTGSTVLAESAATTAEPAEAAVERDATPVSESEGTVADVDTGEALSITDVADILPTLRDAALARESDARALMDDLVRYQKEGASSRIDLNSLLKDIIAWNEGRS